MYSSGYSQVSKHSPQSQKRIQYRSKGKSCGYYMRIVFFFSSLIQSLIIVSLVLFLVYGKKQDSPSTARIQDLEESFSRLSIENVALRQQRTNLTNLLNATLTDKARNDWDLAKIIHYTNVSALIIQDLDRKMQQCNTELLVCRSSQRCPCDCSTRIISGNNCGTIVEQLKAKNDLLESNFTQTVQTMRREMDRVARERDFINLEAIRLRREKSTHEKELEFYRQQSKDDFSQSLKGVTNVSKAFLHKINSLFPVHLAFQLTCPKQQEHLEQIRSNCTSLSREVEDKLQHYLDSVGNQVMGIQIENTRLKAENWRLSEDYRWCTQNRTGVIQENKRNFDKLQQKHDQEKERLLVDKMRLVGDIQVLENTVKYKNKEVEHLNEKMRHLNMTCMSRMGSGGYPSVTRNQPGSSPSSSSTGVGQLGRTGSGGLGSSFGSSGTLFNKPASSATGASSSSFNSLGSSSSSSSTGSLFNKPNSPGGGLSSFGSAGSSTSLSTSGIGSAKPGLTSRGSLTTGSSSGSSSGSTGTTNKSGSTSSGFSWFGLGNTNSGQSKPGSTTGRGTSIGSSSGSSGSVFGSGRTSGTVSVAQHLKDLQRIINPSAPEEKQDLSRMLG